MANEEQLSILKQGVRVWNEWRQKNPDAVIDLSAVHLREMNLIGADFRHSNFDMTNFGKSNLSGANLSHSNLLGAYLVHTNLNFTKLEGTMFLGTRIGATIFGEVNLNVTIGLETVDHRSPSEIATSTLALSKGKIPEVFLRGCGLSDWEIEQAKLYNPDLSKDEFIDIQNRIFDLRNGQAIQISPLFISYSHADGQFVDKIEKQLNAKGIRFWRDTHEMKAGRIEKQIDRAISQNRTVLLVLSGHSIKSDWVEHEVRTARGLEKDMGRDVLCPVALDDSWKNSHWPKRVMEQIMEYNILDFSAWEDAVKFEGMFRKLIDGLELFYKG